MQDFKWTPELWCEFLNQKPLIGALEAEMEQFKSSKSPKKDWEIVAFRHARGTLDVYKLREDGKFRSDETPTGWGFTLEEMIKDEEIIHSVRRLPDASEWQVKETVEIWDTGRFIIEAFEVCTGQMLVKTNGGTFLFGALIKLPQPILVTSDGVEIFPGDEYWLISECDKVEHWRADKHHKGATEGMKKFSTHQAAEEYILNNRPVLSLNDVKKSVLGGPTMNTDAFLESLTALVKQKLNQ